jgi:hypothetical protein
VLPQNEETVRAQTPACCRKCWRAKAFECGKAIFCANADYDKRFCVKDVGELNESKRTLERLKADHEPKKLRNSRAVFPPRKLSWAMRPAIGRNGGFGGGSGSTQSQAQRPPEFAVAQKDALRRALSQSAMAGSAERSRLKQHEILQAEADIRAHDEKSSGIRICYPRNLSFWKMA